MSFVAPAWGVAQAWRLAGLTPGPALHTEESYTHCDGCEYLVEADGPQSFPSVGFSFCDSDGDAFENRVEAQRDYEQDAVPE
jgi:hypothetical protein